MDLVFVQPEAPDVRIPGHHDGDGLVQKADGKWWIENGPFRIAVFRFSKSVSHAVAFCCQSGNETRFIGRKPSCVGKK